MQDTVPMIERRRRD